MRMETEREHQDQAPCKDPQVSSDNIPLAHTIMYRLEKLRNFKKFEGGEEFAIAELFLCLQRAHNTSAETASHLAFLARTLAPDQFTFILKHSVHPLVQLQIPPCLCSPGELKFAKNDLSPEKAFEQQAVNCILPHPHHPNLDGVDAKHPTRCLAAAIHYTLREKDKFRESRRLQISSWSNIRNSSLL